MANSKQTKGSTYETKQSLPEQPFTFPTIGDGVTIMASSQEEANEKAAKLRKDIEQQNSQGAKKSADEKSSDADSAE